MDLASANKKRRAISSGNIWIIWRASIALHPYRSVYSPEHPMIIVLMRHGIAESPSIRLDDYNRRLTDEGRERIQRSVNVLLRMGHVPTRIVTSPLVRAEQTGRVVSNVLNVEMETDRLLAPGASAADVLARAERYREEEVLMLIGHQPDMSMIVAGLTGESVRFDEGAIAAINLSDGDSQATLQRFYRGDDLARG